MPYGLTDNSLVNAYLAAREMRARDAAAKMAEEQARDERERRTLLPEAIVAADSGMPGSDEALMYASPEIWMDRRQSIASAQASQDSADRKRRANIAMHLFRAGQSGGLSESDAIAQANRAGIGAGSLAELGVFGAGELGPEKPADTSQQGELATKLRQEFMGQPFVKEMATADSSFRSLQSMPDSAGGDVAFLIQFMKTLDPNSAVREKEFETIDNAKGLPDRIRSYGMMIASGQRLLPAQRRELLATAANAYKARLSTYSVNSKQYADLAMRYGLRPDDVVMPFGYGVGGKESDRASAATPAQKSKLAELKEAVDSGVITTEQAKAAWDAWVASGGAQ